MDTLKGYISSIIFQNNSNGYTVFSFVTDSGEETVVGNFGPVSEGEMLELTGEWTVHPVYDRQFKMKTYRETHPDDEAAIMRYLGSGIIKGIGPTLAGRIVAEFGKETFDVLERQPERLAKIKGITLKKAREIAITVSEKKGYRDAMIFLGKYGIGNELAIRIYTFYRDEIYNILKENPYKLAEDINGIGFKTADNIAAELGIKADSDYRIRSGIVYSLSLAMSQGHLYLPVEELVSFAAELLGVPGDAVKPQIANLTAERKLIVRNDAVYSATNYYTEQSCAGMLRTLAVDLTGNAFKEGALLREIDKLSDKSGAGLDERQREAVARAVGSGVSIITGGPGTGKTTT
nr:ATP-dependent RecD-like DNA helicase [Lachnospiraceae bacterium]